MFNFGFAFPPPTLKASGGPDQLFVKQLYIWAGAGEKESPSAPWSSTRPSTSAFPPVLVLAFAHILVPIVEVIVSGIKPALVFILLLVVDLGLLDAAGPGAIIVQEKANIWVTVHVV